MKRQGKTQEVFDIFFLRRSAAGFAAYGGGGKILLSLLCLGVFRAPARGTFQSIEKYPKDRQGQAPGTPASSAWVQSCLHPATEPIILRGADTEILLFRLRPTPLLPS